MESLLSSQTIDSKLRLYCFLFFATHDQIFFPIAAVLIPLRPQPEKGQGLRRFDYLKPDSAIKTDEMRIRNAEAASAS